MQYKIETDFIYIADNRIEKLDGVWNQKRKAFRLPNTLGALRELYQMDASKELLDLGKLRKQKQDKLLSLKSLDDAAGDERLRPYQRVDINFLKRVPHAGIFNEQRTGKSPTSLVLAKEMGFQSIVIVCPASLVLNWKEEVKTWVNREALTAHGNKRKRLETYRELQQESFILITSYETLKQDIAYYKRSFDCLIVDEAHRLRNHKSLQSKTVCQLGKQANHRYALTGTPTVKEGHEIYGILRFLYPEKFSSYWQFVERYFHVNDGHFGKVIGKYKREHELTEIIAGISTSRKRSEVMKWLPKKQYQTIRLEATPKQAKAYKSVLETFMFEDKIDAPSVLAQLTRLRQLTTSPEILDIDDLGAKEKFLMEWLEDHPNESVIIFSSFTSYLIKLHQKLKGSVCVHGQMSLSEKQRSVEQFQNGRSRVLLANITAAGTGFTIDKAATTIFVDKNYNPADNAQAEDRMIPVLKERNHSCTVLSLVVENTIDEKIEGLLKNKETITNVINSVNWKEFLS